MAGRSLVHFEFYGRDRKKLQDFYSKLFDWEIESIDQMQYSVIREAGSNGIGGGIADGGDEGPRVVVYMQVPDLMATIQQAESMGGRMLMPPMEFRTDQRSRCSPTPMAIPSDW